MSAEAAEATPNRPVKRDGNCLFVSWATTFMKLRWCIVRHKCYYLILLLLTATDSKALWWTVMFLIWRCSNSHCGEQATASSLNLTFPDNINYRLLSEHSVPMVLCHIGGQGTLYETQSVQNVNNLCVLFPVWLAVQCMFCHPHQHLYS